MTRLSEVLASKLGLTMNGVREYLLGRPHSAYKVAQEPATAQVSVKPRKSKLVNGFIEINKSKDPAVRFAAERIQQKLAYMDERDRLAEAERAKARRRAAIRPTRKVWNLSKDSTGPDLGLVALAKAGRALIEQARQAAEVSKAKLAARVERRAAEVEAKRLLALIEREVAKAAFRADATTEQAWRWYKYNVLCPAVKAAMLPQVG